MKATITLTSISLACITLFSSCAMLKKNNTAGNATAQEQTVSTNIKDKAPDKVSTMPVKVPIMKLDSVAVMQLDGQWTLRSINGVNLSVENGDKEENRPYINFDSRSGKFYANDGCNTINGDFKASQDKKVEINCILSTMMLCPDARYDQQFKQGLQNTTSFKRETKDDENILSFYNQKGGLIMTLVRPKTDFLNGSWTVTEIDGRKLDNKGVKMVIDIPEMRVHGNTGCNIFNGQIFVDPDKDGSIQFQELAVTRMLCPDMETESAFLVALESVEFARQDNGIVQLLNARRIPVLTLQQLDLQAD